MRNMSLVHRRGVVQIKALPTLLWGIFVILFLLAAFSPNPGLGLLGVILAMGISLMLWRVGEPQTLLFLVGFQWLQGFSPILLALYEGEAIATLMGGEEFETATFLTLLGVTIFALGLKFGTLRTVSSEAANFFHGLNSLHWRRLIITWAILCIACMILVLIGGIFPALRQGLLSMTICKWSIVFLLFLYWLTTGKGAVGAILVFATETVIGLMGYFSAFREVYFVFFLAVTGIFSMGKKQTGILIFVSVLIMMLFGFWQAVKGTYRNFLNQGEQAQVIRVSISDRISWMAQAFLEIEGKEIYRGWEEGLRRLGYVEYLGYSLISVPHTIPHTEGKLWKEALLHPLMPRLFFPQKAEINDSDRTNIYATKVAGVDEGTSIGIGYIGESYIDFGYWGMFLPIFFWGWLIGWCFKTVRKCAPHPLLGIALASWLLISTVLWVESSNIKMMGSLISGFLVTLVLMHIFGRMVWAWLTGRSSQFSFDRRRLLSEIEDY